MELALVVLGFVLLVAIVAFFISRGSDAPISGTGDMTKADAEARARSAGIDHLDPGH